MPLPAPALLSNRQISLLSVALGFAITLRIDVGFLDAVLDVADDLTGFALGFIDRALGAQLVVAGHFAERVLRGARSLIERAFNERA
jgi:hypothetical protein